MLKKLDIKFQEALEDEAKLEEQLVRLAKQRNWNLIGAVGLTAYIVAHALFVLFTYQSSISAKAPFGFHVPPGMTLLPLLFLIGVLQYGAKAVIAHCEIRTLIIFKKLRDDKSVVTL